MTGEKERSIGLNWFFSGHRNCRCLLAGFPRLQRRRVAQAHSTAVGAVSIGFITAQVVRGLGSSSRPKKTPSSKSSHIGIASRDWEITSGGVNSMPNTKQPTMI